MDAVIQKIQEFQNFLDAMRNPEIQKIQKIQEIQDFLDAVGDPENSGFPG